ncbi:MAG: thioesterase family protein [Eubacteriales bacterium]
MHSFDCKIKIRYYEVDKTGFVHHAQYFNWFDIAQQEFAESMGVNIAELEEEGFRLLPISNSCNYKTPAVYGDAIIVRLKITDIKSIRIKFGYEVFREGDGRLLATGESEHIVVDADMHITSIAKVFPSIFNTI